VTLIGFALLGICGILIPSLSLYPVLAELAFAVLFTLGIGLPKCWLFKKFGL
jgi:hypothetical protein